MHRIDTLPIHIHAVVHFQIFDLLHRFHDEGIIILIAQAMQRHDRIGHGGIDRAEAAASLHMIEHPSGGALKSLLPNPFDRRTVIDLEKPIEIDEKVSGRKPCPVLLERRNRAIVDLRGRFRIQFVDALFTEESGRAAASRK